jgi:hypothetical protein
MLAESASFFLKEQRKLHPTYQQKDAAFIFAERGS